MGLALVKRIDVCMACYNGAAYLPAMLDSLRAQSGADFRVLMQDDGSADATPKLLQHAADTDPRFVLAAEAGQHLGAVGNFLSLLHQSDADYTALADQDDVWTPTRLSACCAALSDAEARYGADTPLLVHSDCCLIDEQDQVLHASFFAHQGWDPAAVTLPRLIVQNNVTGCTLMMNAALRRLIVSHGTAEAMFMHDWFIALTAAAFGHILFIHQPLIRYRQHGSNVMGASRQTQLTRAAKALAAWNKGKARIALTYRHTAAFRAAYGDALPADAKGIIDAYLATEKKPKFLRILAVQKGGYTMQSMITRAGQLLFG